LLEHTGPAEADGVAIVVRWARGWHGPSLPPGGGQRSGSSSDRLRPHPARGLGLRTGRRRVTVAGAAAEVGLKSSSTYRNVDTWRRPTCGT